MQKIDVEGLIEVRDSLTSQKLKERIEELLHILKEHESFEVTEGGEVIAHVVPVSKPEQSREQNIKAFWAGVDQLAAEIGASWKGNMSAVDAVRDVRRDL